jgi:hypothetical protein
MLLLPATLLAIAGCKQQGPSVYVLESPQTVTLIPSASALKVRQGETVVVRVERRTSGKWKRIARDELIRGQCWVYRPPPEHEAEVADNVKWEVVPEWAVSFNSEYRLDHTRIATMLVKGKVRLTPLSPVACETDRVVDGPSIEIEVGEADA